MLNPLVLSPKECQGKTWHPPVDLSFAADRALLPLHAGELAKSAASMPLALVKEGRTWCLVGVCGIAADRNLFVKNGRWLGGYQPQWLDSHPFGVVMVGEKAIPTFDQDSGLLDTDGKGEPFFDESGRFTPAVAQHIDIIKTTIGLQSATQKALAALDRARLLTPWPEAVLSAADIEIEGLHMVDEKAMTQLSDDAFLELRKARALPIAYAVNFSIQQAHLLKRLARMHGYGPAAPSSGDGDELDLEFLNDGGTISFGPH